MSTAGEPAGGERRIVLQGAYNFRDIGGYVGLDGRTVRPGLVFRSDHPGDLTDADLAEVTGFGIRTVCDMRREPERTGAPSRLEGLPGVTVHHLAIGGEAAQRYAYTARMLAGEIRSFTVAEVVDVYVRLLREFPESVGAAVELIGTAERLPLLVHCTAGKDRTGLVVAAVLELLGVDREVIADDYALTDSYHFEGRVKDLLPKLEAVGVRYEDVAPFLSADRRVLLGTLDWVQQEWGGFAGYLIGAAGLAPDIVERLQENLLEPT